MIHRATSPYVEALAATIRDRLADGDEHLVERLLAAQDDATLDALRTETRASGTTLVFDIDTFRRSPGIVHDDGEEAA